MSIFIIDSPPSCGSSLEAEKQIVQQNNPQLVARKRHLGYSDITSSRHLSNAILQAVDLFLDSIPEDEGQVVIFDWSPVTYRAYGTLQGIKPSQEAIDALRVFSEGIRQKTEVALLMPMKGYKTPPLVRGFDGKMIERFGTELKAAYVNRGFQIQESPVGESPYLDRKKGSWRKLNLEAPKFTLNGQLKPLRHTHSPNRAAG